MGASFGAPPLLSSGSVALGPALPPHMGGWGVGMLPGLRSHSEAQPLWESPGAWGLGRYRPSLGVQGTGSLLDFSVSPEPPSSMPFLLGTLGLGFMSPLYTGPRRV